MNSSRAFTIAAFTLLLGLNARADAIDELIAELPSPVQSAAGLIAQAVPASQPQRQGISDYLSLVGTGAASMTNVGFNYRNQDFLIANPCVNDLAAEFYSKISFEDKEFLRLNPPSSPPPLDAIAITSRPEAVGRKPGWLWAKALELSRGDKNLAMQLIGICGHDNFRQLDYAPPISDAQSAKLALPKGSGIECPGKGSSMYTSQALGAQVDISRELKDRIIRVQAPTKGGDYLPAKNYHIIGAAYAACHLVRRGVPSVITERIAMGAVHAYRSARICEKLEPPRDDDFRKDLSYEKLFEISKAVRTDSNHCSGDKAKTIECKAVFQFDMASDILYDRDLTDEVLLQKIKNYLLEYDVARYFRSTSHFHGSNGCKGPQLSNAVREFVRRNMSGAHPRMMNRCPAGMSVTRCEAVRAKLETFWIDFRWSEEQHQAGVKFALANCPPYDSVNTPEVAACRIVRGETNQTVDPKPVDVTR